MKANKERVFNHAKELVNENGLSHLTIRGLAQKADVSIGTIYNLFDTKDNLIVLLIDDYWSTAIHTMISTIDYKNNTSDELVALYKRYLDISREFHEHWISDLEGIQMSSEPIRRLNEKYRDIVIDCVIKLIDTSNFKEENHYSIENVAQVIHTISINTNFYEEEQFYRELLNKLLS